MPILRSVFVGVVVVLVFFALVAFWSSWSVDQVSTFRAAFHGGANPPPRFVCDTHFFATAGKDTIDWRCDALNTLCADGIQNACRRVAAYKPDTGILAPATPASSIVPNPTFEKSLEQLAPTTNDGASLGIRRKVRGGSINDIPNISPDQIERDRTEDTSTTANLHSAAGSGP